MDKTLEELNNKDKSNLVEAFLKADSWMEKNPSNGVWSHWEHFISMLNWHTEGNQQLLDAIEAFYDDLIMKGADNV